MSSNMIDGKPSSPPTSGNTSPAQAAASARTGLQSKPLTDIDAEADRAASSVASAAANVEKSAERTASAAATGVQEVADKTASAQGAGTSTAQAGSGLGARIEGARQWIRSYEVRNGDSQTEAGTAPPSDSDGLRSAVQSRAAAVGGTTSSPGATQAAGADMQRNASAIAGEPRRNWLQRLLAWLMSIWHAIVRFITGRGGSDSSAQAA